MIRAVNHVLFDILFGIFEFVKTENADDNNIYQQTPKVAVNFHRARGDQAADIFQFSLNYFLCCAINILGKMA